jgi:hypothetical protein
MFAAWALIAMPVTAADNLIQDPGFEEEGQAQWLSYDFGPQFGIDWNASDQKHGGNHALKLAATQTTDVANKWEMSGAKQIMPVRPGDIVTGGAWLMYENLKGVEVFLECKWLDSAQKELGPGLGTIHKTAGSTKWEYQNLEMWTPLERTAPEGAAYVDFRLTLLSAGSADTATGTAWWDDAQFTVIPKK